MSNLGIPPAQAAQRNVPTIDLTESSPPEPPARKRQRLDSGTKVVPLDSDSEDDDQTSDEETGPPLPNVAKEEVIPKKLANTSCIICMEDEPVDLSVTPCGRLRQSKAPSRLTRRQWL